MVKGIVAAGHEYTAQTAADVLASGGNAYDAILAAFFTACVSEPVLSSLGGGGFLLASPTDGKPVLYDFFVHTPMDSRSQEADFFPVSVDFGTTTQDFHIGVGSMATPGIVRGLFDIHRDLCRMPIREIAEPALHLARQGIRMNHFQSMIFDMISPIFLHCPEARSTWGSKTTSGKLAKDGEIVFPLELADSIESIAIEGERLFYEGEIARNLLNMCAQHGGLLSSDDLKNYLCVKRSPLQITYRDHSIITNPPPSSGGLLIGFALKLLEQEKTGALDFGSHEHLSLLCAVMDITNKARIDHMCDNDDDMLHLLDDSLLKKYISDVNHRMQSMRGTTQISIIDTAGNMASMTVSNGEGCGYTIPGTGIMMNNMLGEEDLNPIGFHKWQGDQRMTSMMSPTIVHTENNNIIVTGSGGSNRIRTTLTQVLVNMLDFNMNTEEAVLAPRIHIDNSAFNAEAQFDKHILDAISSKYTEKNIFPEPNLFFGGAHTVMLNGKNFTGSGDPRRGGVCLLAE